MAEDDKRAVPIQMNFNCIYKVKFSKRSEEFLKNLTKEFNNLPEFEAGSPVKPGKGFIDFDNDFEFIVKPVVDYKSRDDPSKVKQMRYEKTISNQNILKKRFRYEKYFEGKK